LKEMFLVTVVFAAGVSSSGTWLDRASGRSTFAMYVTSCY
jgi:hypothetical protein